MTPRVIFSPEADADLEELYDYIAMHGGPARALANVGRITSYCIGFATFPERGTRREDLHPGLRTIGFGRRDTIAFTASSEAVVIIRILHGGRDLDAAFKE